MKGTTLFQKESDFKTLFDDYNIIYFLDDLKKNLTDFPMNAHEFIIKYLIYNFNL